MALDKVLKRLLTVAAKAPGQCALGGGLALRAYGVVRETQDVDLFVLDESRREVLGFLRKKGMEVEGVCEPFHFLAKFREDALANRIDVMFPASGPEIDAIKEAKLEKVEGVRIRTLSAEGLAVMKMHSDRLKDRNDVASLYSAGLVDAAKVESRLEDSWDNSVLSDFRKLIKDLKTVRQRERVTRREGKDR